MQIHETSLHGVKLIEPEPVSDERGWFLRVFSADRHAEAGIDHTRLVQENQSRSRRRTVRGLHTRSTLSEAKLVRCACGEIFDVVVDLRPWSPTFLQHERFILDDTRHLQVFIPPGCAHGFQALSETADVCYRVDAYYDPALDVAVAWNDPEIGIEWPLRNPIVSQRDRSAPSLDAIRPRLAEWFGETAARSRHEAK
jgi:dTDP-4-dehydrorhamnose 3,5-epimerase